MQQKKNECKEGDKKWIFLAKLICSKFVIQKSAFGQTQKKEKKRNHKIPNFLPLFRCFGMSITHNTHYTHGDREDAFSVE